MDITPNKVIHFIGIGGAGMSAIARILLEKNYQVTGSDLKENANTIRLRDCGAEIFLGHDPSNLRRADIIVVSTAIPEENPEYNLALQEKRPILRRAEMLEFLMNQFPKKIAVAGTHGKTTTTAMVTRVLESANMHPTYLIGAELGDYGGNAALGTGPYFVAESDESDGSFLCLHPNISIVNNIEPEHLEYFKNFENVVDHFTKFMKGTLDRDGVLIVNFDDPQIRKIVSKFDDSAIFSFSIQTPSRVMAKDISHLPDGTRFTLIIDGDNHGEVFLRVFGLHNVYNSLAAISLGLCERLSLDFVKKGLFEFHGTKRRFQFIGDHAGIQIFDDYAHHPTEIRTTLEGAKKSLNRRLVCVFQPHRYTRTRDLLEVFPQSFDAADLVVITEVYSAHEKKIAGISGKLIVDRISGKKKSDVLFISKKSEIAFKIMPYLKEGDVVVTMGAGDIHTVGKEIYSRLKAKG